MSNTAIRTAALKFEKQATGIDLTARVPFNITGKEFSALHTGIIDRIKDLTGCPCMSGQVRVVLEGDFEQVLNVSLETGKAL